jgi:hypothetical protein
MYPQTELNRLSTRKVLLRQRIALRRWQCVIDAHRATRPLALLDRLSAQWRQISPWAKMAMVPLGLLLKKSVFPRARVGKSLLRWLPAIAGTLWKVTQKRDRAYAAR